jgi:hypothetical protein
MVPYVVAASFGVGFGRGVSPIREANFGRGEGGGILLTRGASTGLFGVFAGRGEWSGIDRGKSMLVRDMLFTCCYQEISEEALL